MTINRALYFLPSTISLLGLAPVLMLLAEPYRPFVVWIALFQLFMDDLDGMAARKFNVANIVGRNLDDICDVVAHAVIILTISLFSLIRAFSLLLSWRDWSWFYARLCAVADGLV